MSAIGKRALYHSSTGPLPAMVTNEDGNHKNDGDDQPAPFELAVLTSGEHQNQAGSGPIMTRWCREDTQQGGCTFLD